MSVESQVQVLEAFELLQEFDAVIADRLVKICDLFEALDVLRVNEKRIDVV